MDAGDAWESLLERSISTFYEGDQDAGRRACDQLLCLPELPAHVRAVTRTNQVHYARPLRDLAPSAWEQTIVAAQTLSEEPRGLDQLALLGDNRDWLPALVGDDHYLVHLHGATVAVLCDGATGALRLAAFNDAPYVMNDTHGISRIVAIEDGLLVLIHDAVTWESGEESHLYRFARLDRSFQIAALSHPFLVDESSRLQVERLAVEDGALVIASPAVEQRSRLITLDPGDALALLQPVDVLAPHGLHAFPMPVGLLDVLQQSAPPVPPEMIVDLDQIPVLRPEAVMASMPAARGATTGPVAILESTLYADLQERERLIDQLRREREAWHARADEYAREIEALHKAARKRSKKHGKKKR